MKSLVCLLLGVSLAVNAAELGVPFTPRGDDTVLQRVPSSTDPRVRAFDALRDKLAAAPHDLTLAVALARAYLDYGRGTGDARFLGRAEGVIQPWLKAQPVPIPALLVHATILQSKHYFADSQRELLAILRRAPDNEQAWLTLASVAQIQGKYPLARAACARLLGASDPVVPAACLSALNAVTGRAGNAYHTLATLAPQTDAEPPGVQSWVQGIMADAAKYLGDNAAADRHFRAALQLAPGDNFLLADYADFLLDQHRPRAALALVAAYSASDTSFLRQVYAEVALGLPQAAADVEAMARRFAAIDRRGTRAYRREEAGFVLHLLHDPGRALRLAEENWTVQRAPKDARVLLEAALAADRPQAARPVLDFLGESHLQDPIVRALAERAGQRLASVPTTTAASTAR